MYEYGIRMDFSSHLPLIPLSKDFSHLKCRDVRLHAAPQTHIRRHSPRSYDEGALRDAGTYVLYSCFAGNTLRAAASRPE